MAEGERRRKPRNRQSWPEVPEVRYLVNGHEGDFIIALPAHWKLTFGYVNPANPERGYGGQSAHCLRVYEGEKLRAVYSGIRGFRDMSIPTARKFQTETGSANWTRDDDGNFESHKRLERELAWDNDDDGLEVFGGSTNGVQDREY